MQIISADQDTRQYEFVTLSNKLRVCLVHDDTVDKAAAAMDVFVGQLQDPKEIPGLAHFCEHMLFLGSKKFPVENCFSKFLATHGGSSNAFTSLENTNYYFDVQHDHFKNALEIWSQFFVSPLFNKESKDKEINAVNSEHEKNIAQDAWRLNQLDKSTSNENHPYSSFGTGNFDTLDTQPKKLGLDVCDELLNFYHKYYSANIMVLCLIGREPLHELKSMAERFFIDIVNKDVEVPVCIKQKPYLSEQLTKIYNIVPIKDHHFIDMSFVIYDTRPFYKEKPERYIAHLIGHEGPGSLLAYLKEKGWVSTLVCGDGKRIRGGFGTFKLGFEVTEIGLGFIDEIILALFEYINLLKQVGPQKWIFDECADLGEMHFQFKDKEKSMSYACNIASSAHIYPPEHILSGSRIHYNYDPELITKTLEYFTPDNMRIFVVSPKFQGKTDLIEPWYGTKYSCKTIDDENLTKYQSAGLNEKLFLPHKNEFIPTDFEILSNPEMRQCPVLVSDNEYCKLWYKQDDKFFLPKAIILAEITSNFAYLSPKHCVCARLFVDLLKDSMTEYSYDALLSGLFPNLENTTAGLSLNIQGFSHKLKVLLECVITKIREFKVDENRFGPVKDKLRRQYKNFSAEQAYHHCIYNAHLVSVEKLWTHDQKLNVIGDITPEMVNIFVQSLLKHVNMQILVCGNLSVDDAREIQSIIQKVSSFETPVNKIIRPRHVKFPVANRYVFRKNESVNEDNAILQYVVVGADDIKANILLDLFDQMSHERFFNQLRTNEQLGYIVHAGSMQSHSVTGMRFIIQSDKSPVYLQERIDTFLIDFETYLENVTKEEFDQNIQTLKGKKLQKVKTLPQEVSRYWMEITADHYNFQREQIEAKELEKLTKEDLVEFFVTKISPSSTSRRCVSIWAYSCSTPFDATEKPDAKNTIFIDDVSEFKRSCSLFPKPHPWPFSTI